MHIMDKHTGHPITDAHVFIDQSSFVQISDKFGKVELPPSIKSSEVVLISHVNYGLRQFVFSSLFDSDTIYMENIGLNLENVVVSAKASKKRNKWIKKFSRAFLGVDQQKYNVYIHNHDALLFNEENGILKAKSSDLIEIINEGLGVKINYFLEDFQLKKTGQVSYHGKYFIQDYGKIDENILQARKEATYNTVTHFLTSLISDEYKNFYFVSAARQNNSGVMENMGKVNVQGLLSKDDVSGVYSLSIPAFLQIEHLTLSASGFTNKMRGAQGIGHRVDQESVQENLNKAGKDNSVSYLFSNTSRLDFDENGTILNSAYIHRYGYWAGKGMANVLPAKLYKNKTGRVVAFGTMVEDAILRMANFPNNYSDSDLRLITENFDRGLIAPLAEIMVISNNEKLRNSIHNLLQQKTAMNPGSHGLDWLRLTWNSDYKAPVFYPTFKAKLYRNIDEEFLNYFDLEKPGTIPLNEIVWGGVKQDGIPPLIMPDLITSEQASYLSDEDVVFGIHYNGQARAYPQRILGWHEMVIDQIGAEQLTGVYCTLCGTMIVYKTNTGGGRYEMGTSGFLYRSNKLMYDKKTQSLWSTIEGQPVIGDLVGDSIKLEIISVETTTWANWKQRHPQTLVLNIETGYNRNYAEGEAYKKYFNSDDLMFPVPIQDDRLKNKEVVFVLRHNSIKDPVAFAKNYLNTNALVQYSGELGNYIVITTNEGNSRAFFTGNHQFRESDGKVIVSDKGEKWTIDESKIVNQQTGESRVRIPSHEVFWFAWVNAHPNTKLIKS